ncbi:MAG: glycosyltransferase family 4 protein [Bacteroidales bacterium]
MIIGIEAQRIFRKKKHGMDMVALELIRNLQKIDTENQYYIFVKPDEDSACLDETPNFKIIELGGGPYPSWEQIALPRAAEKYKCDILHCTSNTAPVRGKTPLITTVHDIIYMEGISLLKKGGTLYQKFGNMYRRLVVPPVIRKSKKVITVSEFEKQRIADFFGLKDDKLVAVYNGVGRHFQPVTDEKVLSEAKQKYGLPDNFLFFLGNTDPKKNTPTVLKSFALFNWRSETKYKLVMLDYEENALMSLLREIGHPEIRKDIHLTGYVPNMELPSIISQAKIFLYPSLRESFGIPILEGMACGVPVITSNTSSMPEVAGDAALLVDPKNPNEIVRSVNKLLDDPTLKADLAEKGLRRAQKFSWENMAISVAKLYKETYKNL